MIIRKFQHGDTGQVYNILLDEWGVNTADRIINQVMSSTGAWTPEYYVAVETDSQGFFDIQGFGGFAQSPLMNSVYELTGLAVKRNMRGKGIGGELTTKRLQEIEKRGGSMAMTMTKQIEFFQNFGFTGVADIDNWTLMVKKLKPKVDFS